MPTITRWFIKTAFVYFFLALLAGIILGVQAVRPFAFPVVDLLPPYYHLLAEGWITMLIIGVAIWMFPKFSLEQPRGNIGLGWASYVLLNVGLLLRVISEPLNAVTNAPGSLWAVLLAAAAALQWLGGLAFVIYAWPRIKEK